MADLGGVQVLAHWILDGRIIVSDLRWVYRFCERPRSRIVLHIVEYHRDEDVILVSYRLTQAAHDK